MNKGADRPVNTLDDRAAVIAALSSVSIVTWFDTDTPLELIMTVRPEVLVKGGDWKPSEMVGAREVSSWNGAVHSIPFAFDRSTTATLMQIRGSKT